MTDDSRAAWSYHNATKHSVARLQAQHHYLDWEIKPLPFKVYPTIEPIPLPREIPASRVPALAALTQPADPPRDDASSGPTLVRLARLLHLSAGITRKKVYADGQEYHFRAAPCTGALYHVDVYVICGDLPGLPAGVYHFGPHNFALHRLRAGDHRGVLVAATGDEPAAQHAPVILAYASTYWRNSWKYQARAYRHCFWDCGTILANLLAAAAADTLPARVITGFVDDRVCELLGLDSQREAPLALVAVGHLQTTTPPQEAVPSISPETLPLSPREVDYPLIREMQAASTLPNADAVRAWRAQRLEPNSQPVSRRDLIALQPSELEAPPAEPIDAVIARRGSTRRFVVADIALSALSSVLVAATQDVVADYGASPNQVYLIVNGVTGLAPGTYVYHRAARALECLGEGECRRAAGHLGLGQDLPADASVNLYILCDLQPVLTRFGTRGYRVAQLDAAIAGGRAYLAAYALRLGATGLTFFDDDVTDFFSPHAAGKSVMFLVAVGHGRTPLPIKR
jgi:SagB-type dehydrogenase family enzyme